MGARGLVLKNFDALVPLPGSPPAGTEAHGFTPTAIGGLLVRLSIWAGTAWWLAHKHGHPELAASLLLILKRTWAVAGLLVAALTLGSLLASRLIDVLAGFSRQGPEPGPGPSGVAQ